MNNNENVYFGDMHNHCNLSYGKGSLEDALKNAAQKLDFCSVTGHAHWCDMPEPNDRIAHIVDFHIEGFTRLKERWSEALEILRAYNRPGSFLTFPGFEVHSSADGDRTIIYNGDYGEILYPANIGELQSKIRELGEQGTEVMAVPHHVGYRQGARGINWLSFDERVSPVVEIYSMHGSSEDTGGPFPPLHSMGPADWRSTIAYGLAHGHIFGFVAGTDHHSAYPGSYGQGMTGVWAPNLSREAIWKAHKERRVYALSGDKIELDYSLGDAAMGAVIKPGEKRNFRATIAGGAAIDYLDILHNNKIVHRVSCTDMDNNRIDRAGRAGKAGNKNGNGNENDKDDSMVTGIITLEAGWGHRGKRQAWDIGLELSDGEIFAVEPRFRGPDILSPLQEDSLGGEKSTFYSQWERLNNREIALSTLTYGNATNTSPGTQGISLKVNVPRNGSVYADFNGKKITVPVAELLEGGRSGYLIDEIDSPAWLLHRIPEREQFMWDIELPGFKVNMEPGDFLYVRARQHNGQWAWGSPVFGR